MEGEAFYIDGINVANEPTSVLMNLLRNKIHPQARRVRVFAVSSLPVSRSSLSDSDRQYQGLMPVVRRVLALKRFRDAFLERSLTELHTRVADLYVRKTPTVPDTALQSVDGETIVRADIYGIEPDEALDLNQGIAKAKNVEERRLLIREAVAKGCRASLETMIHPSITTQLIPGAGSCWRAIRSRLAAEPSLPGSHSSFGPGVAEVCQACALNQGEELSLRPSLRSLTEHASSVWPRRNAVAKFTISQEESKDQPQTTECTRQTPQVALLFSGGVFRGVFQMGSIAALSEAGVKPQIFAGASVGSITAAMAAHLFVEHDPRKRDREIALLATTYLALDRLVLTDRFADFVRRFTLRAGAAEFSVSDADRFFRRYDQGAASALSRSVRRVVAGLERLFYLTPFELLNLLRALRLSNTSDVVQLLVDSVQDFLDRFEVGDEILGSEPLAFLIAHHVLTKSDDPRETFASFAQRGKTILAVTTNLTKGRLELLPGLDATAQDPVGKAVLLEALLASSAFPAVFRPRWSWEVFPHSGEICQFVDGGVMDNLPLDAVVQYLRDQVINNELAPRPISSGIRVPHLLFAASLEPRLRVPKSPQKIASNWPALRTRSRQLSY
jgi:predicted acylesterase/phospholipase RssA